MMRTVKILVAGHVQGVYFRAFTQNKAKHLSVNGCVKNLPDGRVEIIAQADDMTVEKFIQWCHKGPATAKVDHVEIIELEVDHDYTSFTIG